jgi:hypothetical protein
MNVVTGDYLTPIQLNGDYSEKIDGLGYIIMIDRPDKVIFDKRGAGFGFYQTFLHRMKDKPFSDKFEVDAFGLITFKDEDIWQ